MWIILFWLICAITVIAERAVFLWGASINKDVFLATMQKCILAGDVAKAVKMCSAAERSAGPHRPGWPREGEPARRRSAGGHG